MLDIVNKEIQIEIQPALDFWGGAHITEVRCKRGRLLYQAEDSYERIRLNSSRRKIWKPIRYWDNEKKVL